MGQNRTLPTPEAYPIAFHVIVREGGGVLYLRDVPWTRASTVKRFRLFINLLRRLKAHPLHTWAQRRWSVEATAQALLITSGSPTRDSDAGRQTLGMALIERAISGPGGVGE